MTDRRIHSGADITPEGVRFRLFSRHAEAVEVCLFDAPDQPETDRVPLAKADDGEWIRTIEDLGAGQLYGFRVHGPYEPSAGHRFNPAKLLTDPRGLAITGEPPLDDAFHGELASDARQPDPRDTALVAPKAIVVDRHFDWQGDVAPRVSWNDTLIYECHVRGMTMRHPEIPPELRGTYRGLASPPLLEHFEKLGITCLELLPVQQIASEPHLQRNDLRNYFGYSPLGLFAPHASYATAADGRQVAEFKEMVRTLHEHGIEVVLDVVFNHTAEGGRGGRTLCFRGIDNRTYYRLPAGDMSRYVDTTGCGNSVAAAKGEVASFLVDCMRYWVDEMHVDGFRFDLAVALGRFHDSLSFDSSFFAAVAADPVLSRIKLIAEPWDLGPDGYQRGNFPAPWVEWNDRFRDATRRVWRGDPVPHGELTGLFSSLDAADREPRGKPRRSVHFVTCHDGFTLQDLVSFEAKNNWDNMEGNRDGHDHNLSRNWGVEGPTDIPEILERRRQAGRNMLATVLLSPGVPMLNHGDEIQRSQNGNNNAYCQDNESAWIDWQAPADGMPDFIASLVSIRRRLQPLRGEDAEHVDTWYRPDGRVANRSAADPGTNVPGLLRSGPDGTFLLLVNPGESERLFRLPRSMRTGIWRRLVSTTADGIKPVTQSTYRLTARSIVVLEYVAEPISRRQPPVSCR